MHKLVSVIIPCFNAHNWVAEAIDSCLHQTYPHIEIIVIDDGSTDDSLKVIKRYGDRIIWETGENRGGNHARNRGFHLAKGDYIQYLDADDYILPEKIQRHIETLETTNADVVYGDWRYQYHASDGSISLGDIQICGPKDDFLESLLANEQWTPPVALLFKRSAIVNQDWDETLKSGQDRDFLISLAVKGAQFVYQSGCYAIYRRHSRQTASTLSKLRLLTQHCRIMEKAEYQLTQLDKLSDTYRQALATAYVGFGRFYLYGDYPSLSTKRYIRYLRVLDKALSLSPEFQAKPRSVMYVPLQRILGCRRTEKLAYFISNVKARFLRLRSKRSPLSTTTSTLPPKQPIDIY
ncbi:MAG: glycosyltransferase family 2 protein [Elainellaceae cyanobacterium]